MPYTHVWKRVHFDAFKPSVHTNTLSVFIKNASILKRSWKRIKTKTHTHHISLDSRKRFKTVVWTRNDRCVFHDNENAYFWKRISVDRVIRAITLWLTTVNKIFFPLRQTINCKIREKIISFPASWLKRNGNKLAALFKLLLKRQGEKIFRKSLYDTCPWTREAVIRPDVSGQRRLAARTLQKKRWRKTKTMRYKAYKNTVTNLPLLVIDVYALWNIFEYYAELSEQTPRCCSRSHSLEFCYKIVGAHFCVKEENLCI